MLNQLVKDLRYWPGVAAIGLEALGISLLGAARVEKQGPTCFVAICDGADIPSPGFLLAVVALGTAPLLTVVSLINAGLAAPSLIRTRGREQALIVVAGVAAFVAAWVGAAVLGPGRHATFPLEWLAGTAFIIAYFAVASWMAPLAVGYAMWRVFRSRSFDRQSALLAVLGAAAIVIFGAWIVAGQA